VPSTVPPGGANSISVLSLYLKPAPPAAGGVRPAGHQHTGAHCGVDAPSGSRSGRRMHATAVDGRSAQRQDPQFLAASVPASCTRPCTCPACRCRRRRRIVRCWRSGWRRRRRTGRACRRRRQRRRPGRSGVAPRPAAWASRRPRRSSPVVATPRCRPSGRRRSGAFRQARVHTPASRLAAPRSHSSSFCFRPSPQAGRLHLVVQSWLPPAVSLLRGRCRTPRGRW
jgi:hypothetical protein